MKILIVLALLFLSFSSFASSTDIKSWAEENSHRLDSLTSVRAKQVIKDFLIKELMGKKFVYLGEPTHWVHEKWEYRSLFISVLMELGYTNIINEMGYVDAQKIDAYLRTGNSRHLKTVCLYGGCDESEAREAFVSEEISFYKFLYKESSGKNIKLRHFGYDIDTKPKTAYKVIISKLKAHSDKNIIAKTINRLKVVSLTSGNKEVELIWGLFKNYKVNEKKYKRILKAKGYRAIYWDLRSLYDSLSIMNQLLDSYQRHIQDPADQQAKADFYQAFINREPTMFDRTRYILSTLPKNEKFIVLGHNSHLSKYSKGMTVNAFGIIQNQPLWLPYGEWLSINNPSETYNVWMGIGQGSYNSTFGECSVKVCTARPVKGTIEEKFTTLSDKPWIASLSESPLGRNTFFSAQMIDKETGHLNKAADAYFFIPKVTEMKILE